MGRKESLAFNSHVFHEGTQIRGYEFFGSHEEIRDGVKGYIFRVWAPNAKAISVVGAFNQWKIGANPMELVEREIWAAFVPGLQECDTYKFAVTGADGETRMKADPYAFYAESGPQNASKLYNLSGYEWHDREYKIRHHKSKISEAPMNAYEVHLGSWKRHEDGTPLQYRELAEELIPYVSAMGYNYIELLPIMEHSLEESWGYQTTGYFAPTSRYGTPKDFMYFVDCCHQAGIGVILDWVPAHFAKDAYALIEFDGSPCYEYADTAKWEHEKWNARVFHFGKPEVKSFLLSCAEYWLTQYHVDGLRINAVSYMLYQDYAYKEGQTGRGGKEHPEAIAFLKDLNRMASSVNPDVLMIAEESAAWPNVSKSVDSGGLGFHLKWNTGWMYDMRHYMKMDSFFRKDHHKDVTFSLMYAFHENFVLTMAHDEFVAPKGSLFEKMFGEEPWKTAGIRVLYAYMMLHPGKKLVFMGSELGQRSEWQYDKTVEWNLLETPLHKELHTFFKEINHFYLQTKELWEEDFSWDGFEWIVSDDSRNNVVVFQRKDKKGKEVICVVNFSPVELSEYRFGVPRKKEYKEIFNSNLVEFGGTGSGNPNGVKASWIPSHGSPCSIAVTVPPMAAIVLKGDGYLRMPKTKGTK